MRVRFYIAFCFLSVQVSAQTPDNSSIPAGSLLKGLKPGDSITFYQCHVEEAIQQLATASGQTLTGKPQKYTITEKYVLLKQDRGFHVNYYTSSLAVFPNKKFSGLKIRERPYWAFKKEKAFDMEDKDLNVFLALERKGREAMEYDYPITRYTTNQIIIKQRKEFKQLVIEGNYVISRLIRF